MLSWTIYDTYENQKRKIYVQILWQCYLEYTTSLAIWHCATTTSRAQTSTIWGS
ncbi:hypothetical protein M413DRAFT_444736 [Hebeloma cylindrosporum]|uniref:Uncharacterized protein n=1 Tax=Hebeloma cylindrosporum TaxID=76867 RepID=A0A0C3CDK4_HEBCY|nr:hypothetical protein M413DRAFT_444736 [Hebeloma cylindrosporum h7]